MSSSRTSASILLERLERGVTVGNPDRGVPFAGELAHEELAKVLLIVGDEDADGAGHGPCLRSERRADGEDHAERGAGARRASCTSMRPP